MTVALTEPRTAELFLDWVGRQESRFEFDGLRPVAMTGGDANHDDITGNIRTALRSRLRAGVCKNYGPNLAVQTVGDKMRFPDALITCTKFLGTERIAPHPVAVFEVVGPTSGRDDHFVKLREYQAVPSILTYIIVESASVDLLVYHRQTGEQPFVVVPLTSDGTLDLPNLGIQIPVAEFYDGVELPQHRAEVAPRQESDAS
jgi:Uma2 family endonuclease